MTKFYFTSLFIVFFSFGFSQSYPYLNASTANEGEFPVDKDTSIFMFHGNRLVKTDKNFNTIWANTYSGFSISNLLLSKTGSVYFLGKVATTKIVFGKINPNGSLNWVKTIQNLKATISGTVFTVNSNECMRIFLDGNNNLLISGTHNVGSSGPNYSNAFLIKTDTSGNVLKFKAFNSNYATNFSILNDSAGVYKFAGSGFYLSGVAICLDSYADNTDLFVNSKWGGITPAPSTVNWQILRSKVSNSFYLNAMISPSGATVNGIIKFTDKGQVKWSKGVATPSMGPNLFFGRVEEDNKGDLFYSLSCGPTCTSYTSAFIKLDSNGVSNSYLTTLLNGYYVGTGFPPPIPNHSQRSIHNNNYYFDISGNFFPTNPLTVQKFNSTLSLPCASTLTATFPSIGLSGFFTVPSPTIVPVSSYTIPVFVSSVTPVTFSVNQNFCTVVGQNELKNDPFSLTLFPNPAQSKIQIGLGPNYSVETIEIFDSKGKNIKRLYNASEIDISEFPAGIYFLKIKTDKGEVNRKFVKEE